MNILQFERILERAAASVHAEVAVGLAELGVIVEKAAKEMIGHEHDHWPPLAASTIADKAAKGYAVPAPLLRTGEMRDSIKHETDPVALELIVGSDDEIAKYQELGTVRIPPRPFLGTAMARAAPEATSIFGKIAVKLLTGKKL